MLSLRPIPWVALALSLLVYIRLIPVYYCGFDDFTHGERAAFEDSRQPARMFTTTHFQSSKYRPLNRVWIYLAHMMPDAPLAHRLRNIISHLVAVWLVFLLARQMGLATNEAGWAAALFGVHPMAHQTVAAALFTIDTAGALLLASLVLWGEAFAKGGSWRMLAAFLTLELAILTYESSIVGPGWLTALCLLAWWRNRHPADGWPRFLKQAAVGCAVITLVFFVSRFLFVEMRSPVTPPVTVVMNLGLYAISMMLPVDLVMLNSLFSTPLPSEIVRNRSLLLTLAGAGLVAALPVALWTGARLRQRWPQFPGLELVYLGTVIVLTLAPFLVFSGHPSETYLYIPAAFFAIGFVLFFRSLCDSRGAVRLTVALISLAAVGSFVRTERVRECGLTAGRIVQQLPVNQWRSQNWEIVVAEEPNSPPMRRMGLYGYRGLGTIDPAEPGSNAIRGALRMETGNEGVMGMAVAPDQLLARCRPARQDQKCYWISASGHVTPFAAEVPASGEDETNLRR